MRNFYLIALGFVISMVMVGCKSSVNDSDNSNGDDGNTYYVQVTTPSGPVDCIVIRTVRDAGVTCNWQ